MRLYNDLVLISLCGGGIGFGISPEKDCMKPHAWSGNWMKLMPSPSSNQKKDKSLFALRVP